MRQSERRAGQTGTGPVSILGGAPVARDCGTAP